MKRSPLTADPLKVQAFQQRARRASKPKRGPVSPASKAQREHVRDQSCLVCGADHVHPAHLIDRSLLPVGADDARAVVPLCPTHHRAYDLHELSLLEYLEPRFRVELAFAVERFGLLSTLQRVTGEDYAPVERAA